MSTLLVLILHYHIFSSAESWFSAQNYCASIGGSLPVLRQWESLYRINSAAKPWPVYIGMTQVSAKRGTTSNDQTSLVVAVVNEMATCHQLGASNQDWVRVSVAVPMVHVAIFNL